MAKLLLKQASGLVRSALQPAITAWMIVLIGTNGVIGALGVGALGISMVVFTASPAKARCLVAGQIRDDISDVDCPEAQHTGCIRSKLSPAKYIECLAAQPTCLLGGRRRTDLPGNDCFEAQRTGYVRERPVTNAVSGLSITTAGLLDRH